jgi:hypothetical protein
VRWIDIQYCGSEVEQMNREMTSYEPKKYESRREKSKLSTCNKMFDGLKSFLSSDNLLRLTTKAMWARSGVFGRAPSARGWAFRWRCVTWSDSGKTFQRIVFSGTDLLTPF